MGNYQHEHTRTWAKTVSGFDGFIFVTAEYNHSVPGVLKNALDFLHAEWNNKAVGFVSYRGAGGVRAVESLRLIAGELQMADVRAQVALPFATDFENFTTFTPSDTAEEDLKPLLEQLISWTTALKPSALDPQCRDARIPQRHGPAGNTGGNAAGAGCSYCRSMSDVSVRDAKSNLRAEIRLRRRSRSEGEQGAATAGLTEHLIALVRHRAPALVGCYLSGGDEPNTRPFLSWAAANGVDVLVPVSRRDGLLDWVPAAGGSEQVGLFGISEMVGEVVPASVVQSVDLLLIPAAAVDRSGMRMGWGRGYFDRALASLEEPPAVFAVIYDEEFLESVPRESHDRPVDGVVTPSGTRVF